jgi:hypothetical protein
MQDKVTTNIFPCKSLNLMRFLKEHGLQSELKYTDAKDNKDCWVFLRNDKLHELLTEWDKTKQNYDYFKNHKQTI